MNAPAGKPEEVVSGPIPPATHRIFFRVFPSVMLPMFLAMSDQTIVASALPAIAGALGDVERVSWIVVAYLLAATISAPLYGYLGDSFGRRRLMFIALAMFTTGAILNSLAPSVTLIAVSRFIQGLGGGGLMSMSQALIGEVVPPRQRGQYQGYLAAISVSAAALGPVAGGFLAEHFGWR
ncbi:MAG: MFS transporter, partial [Beijerinckiaceae bacterium]|nr:MFS transporter [Beijerinckiaceae bacterium]